MVGVGIIVGAHHLPLPLPLHGEVVKVGGEVTAGAHPLPLPLLLVGNAKEVRDTIGVGGVVVDRLPFLTACIPCLIFLLSQGILLGPL